MGYVSLFRINRDFPHGSPTGQTFDKTMDGYRVILQVTASYLGREVNPRSCIADGIMPREIALCEAFSTNVNSRLLHGSEWKSINISLHFLNCDSIGEGLRSNSALDDNCSSNSNEQQRTKEENDIPYFSDRKSGLLTKSVSKWQVLGTHSSIQLKNLSQFIRLIFYRWIYIKEKYTSHETHSTKFLSDK